MKYRLTLFLITIIGFLASCKIKESAIGYNLKTYMGEGSNVKNIHIDHHLISYQDYLLEFNLKLNKTDTLIFESETIKSSGYYDTIGVYLLNPHNRTFVEFDKFSSDAKIISKGNLSQKKYGYKYSDTGSSYFKRFSEEKLKDTSIWNQNLLYFNYFEKDKTGKDSIVSTILFSKIKEINSPYDYVYSKFINPKLSMVGYITEFKKENLRFVSSFENIRYLKKSETSICRLLVERSNSK